jgi:hypothetical protein
MLIDNLLKKIDFRASHRGYYKFETFIINLLKVHQEKNNKPFISQSIGSRYRFDAYASEGIEDIVGGTAIEIKINIGRIPSRMLVEQVLLIQSRHLEFNQFETILFITATPISSKWLWV